MTAWTCFRASGWLQARKAGLSSAAALRLEDHLAHCASCSRQAQLLDELQTVSDAAAQPLSPGARQRAVLQAFALAERPLRSRAAKPSWLAPSVWGAAAAVALVALGVVLRPELGSEASTAHGDRVISGELHAAGTPLGAGRVLPEQAALRTDVGAVVALAHATVELRAQTRVRWDARDRVLRLERGSLLSEVDPRRREPFTVETEHFRVYVLGTRFEVSSDRVRVARGRVQIVGFDGVERARLGAGESYVWPEAGPVAAADNGEPRAPAPPQTAAASAPEAEPARGERSGVRRGGSSGRLQPGAIDALLNEARTALGVRDVARAEQLVRRALAAGPRARQRAEALTLRAECSFVAGDLAAAADGYFEVADRFAGMAAGENALFAGARIEADRLRGPAAERGLQRYLERYPRGRFVKEAAARLRELRGDAEPVP